MQIDAYSHTSYIIRLSTCLACLSWINTYECVFLHRCFSDAVRISSYLLSNSCHMSEDMYACAICMYACTTRAIRLHLCMLVPHVPCNVFPDMCCVRCDAASLVQATCKSGWHGDTTTKSAAIPRTTVQTSSRWAAIEHPSTTRRWRVAMEKHRPRQKKCCQDKASGRNVLAQAYLKTSRRFLRMPGCTLSSLRKRKRLL